jgi:hypothetical protein
VGLLFFAGCRSRSAVNLPALSFACHRTHSIELKFTIDKLPDLGYHFVCYLEQTSLTAPAIPALTLDLSISCSLFCFAQKVNSFGIKQIQPLFAK